MQWLQVGILASMALGKRQCTLEWGAQNENVWGWCTVGGSAESKAVYTGGANFLIYH